MDEALSIATIYRIFAQKGELIQRFVTLQNEYASLPLEYGGGESISLSELTVLTGIEEHPGITTTELAALHRKTKAAVSQTVKKLEQRKLVCRKRCPIDGKRALLHINEEGKKITAAHKKQDLSNVQNSLDQLLAGASVEEVDAFFKVLGLYSDILEKGLKKDKEPAAIREEEDDGAKGNDHNAGL